MLGNAAECPGQPVDLPSQWHLATRMGLTDRLATASTLNLFRDRLAAKSSGSYPDIRGSSPLPEFTYGVAPHMGVAE